MLDRRWKFLFAAAVGAMMLTLPHAVIAQTGIVGGTVYRDTNFKDVLTGVEVTIPTLNRRTVTNYAGDFRISGLAAGKYAIVLRHVGFAPLTDTVVVADNAPVDKEYSLVVQAVTLDSVRVTEKEKPRYVSPLLNAFVERLTNHNGGYFMDETLLRQSDSRKLQDLLSSRIPGVHAYRPFPKSRPSFEYLSSGRGPNSKTTSGNCPVALYLNGVVFYNPATDRDGSAMPDFNQLNISEYAGVEYYPGGGSIPNQYNMTGNGCGVLLLWSRER